MYLSDDAFNTFSTLFTGKTPNWVGKVGAHIGPDCGRFAVTTNVIESIVPAVAFDDTNVWDSSCSYGALD